MVEDNFSFLKALKEILINAGYDVTTATDGKEGLEYIKDVEFDLLLTDIKMPKMSGDRLLLESKKLRPDLMVIIITAYGTMDLAIKCLKEGTAFDFLDKTGGEDNILSSVEKAINMRNLKRLPGKMNSSLEELLKTTEPSAFSITDRLALRNKINEYTHEFVDLSLKISKHNFAGSASEAYIKQAGYQIANDTDSRLFKYLGTIGGILFGVFLAGFSTMAIYDRFTMITTIVSALFGISGAFLIALPIVYDLRKREDYAQYSDSRNCY